MKLSNGVGFGFLLVFPYLYSWSAVAFNFMMGAFVLQWSLLTLGMWDGKNLTFFSSLLTCKGFLKKFIMETTSLKELNFLLNRM